MHKIWLPDSRRRCCLQDGWTPLTRAADNGQTSVVELLLNKGVKGDVLDEVGLACRFKFPKPYSQKLMAVPLHQLAMQDYLMHASMEKGFCSLFVGSLIFAVYSLVLLCAAFGFEFHLVAVLNLCDHAYCMSPCGGTLTSFKGFGWTLLRLV